MQCNDSEEISVGVHDLMALRGQHKESADFLGSIIFNVLLQVHFGVGAQHLLCIRPL